MAQLDQLSQDLCLAPWRAMELVTAFCLAPALDRDGLEQDSEETHLEAQKLLDDLDVVFTDKNRRAFILWIRRIDARRDEYGKSLLLWIDLIEEIAFEVEKDLGSNTGPVKLRRVRGAVFYLLERMTEGLQTPGIPRYLNRFGLHLAIRGTVEFIVTLDNPEKYQAGVDPISPEERKLWGARPRVRRARARSDPSAGFFDRIAERLRDSSMMVGFFKWWEPLFGGVLDWLMDKLLAPPWVSPSFKRRVDVLLLQLEKNIDRDSASHRTYMQDMFSSLFEVIRWIGRHGKEVRAAIDALSIAFHLTAKMEAMERNHRIKVVKEALILYFEDLDLRGPYFRFMLRIVVDVALDALNLLYQKRQERMA